MKLKQIDDFTGGWVVGNFDPSLFKGNFEVGFRSYKAGETSKWHYHKVATEINICTKGRCAFILPKDEDCIVAMKGDIVIVEPNEAIIFEAITDCDIVCIKTASVPNDKYLVEQAE